MRSGGAFRLGGIVIALTLWCAPAALATPVTIDFESGGTPGQQITNEYGPPATPAGPTFEKGTDAGFDAGSQPAFSGLHCSPPFLDNSDTAYSGSRSINLQDCGIGENYAPSATFFALGYSTDSVDFFVGVPGGTPSSCQNFICNEIVTTAFDANRNVVMQEDTLLGPNTSFKEVALTSNTDNIAFVAIEEGSKSPQSSDSATGVNLTTATTGLLVDDLTYDPPSSPPASSFVLGANPTKTSVAAGDHVSVKIPITWTNNPNPSLSPVSLEANTPAGVAASFNPQPATSGSSTLTLTADKTAFAGDTSVIVTGFVDKGQPSQKQASVTIPLTVTQPFFAPDPGAWKLAPCTPQQIPIRANTVSDFSQPLTLSVDMHNQPGVKILGISGSGQVLDDKHAQTTVSQQNGQARATLTVEAAPGASPQPPRAWFVHVDSTGYETQATTGSVAIEAGHVTSVLSNGVATVNANTPQLGSPGTALTLHGAGFCPGTAFKIGGGAGDAASADSISGDGTTLSLRVPRDSTSGPIMLLPPSGTPFDGPDLTIHTFRDTWGFSWLNKDYGMRLNGQMVDGLFGEQETNANILGVWVRKPEASLFEAITNNHIPGGLCFGMAYTSLALRQFPKSLPLYPNSGGTVYFPGTDPWHLNGPSMPSNELLQTVTENFSLQFTDELIPVALGAILGVHGPDDDINLIKAELANGYPVPIGLISWSGLSSAAHTVLAYDTEPLAGGKVAIDVYNPNVPYLPGEASDSNLHHTNEFTNSQIIYDHGNWSFPELGWSGSEADMVVYKHKDLPIINGQPPHLPNLFVVTIMVVFGSAGDHVTQVTGAGGGSLFDRGTLAPRAKWPNGVAPLPDFNTARHGVQTIAADPRRVGDLTATVRRGAGGGAMSVQLPGLLGELDAGSHPGQIDHVSIDPHAGAIAYRTNTKSTGFGGTLLSAPAAGVAAGGAPPERVVQFHLRSGRGGSERISFRRGGSFVLRHSGKPTKLTLTFSAFGRAGLPVAIRLPEVSVASGETLRATPVDWRSPSAVRLTSAVGGRTHVRVVHGRSLARPFARATDLRLGRGSLALRLSRTRRVGTDSWISVAAVVTRHGRVVTRLSAPPVAGGAVRLPLRHKLSAGRYAVKLKLLETTASGPVQGSVLVRRTLRLGVR